MLLLYIKHLQVESNESVQCLKGFKTIFRSTTCQNQSADRALEPEFSTCELFQNFKETCEPQIKVMNKQLPQSIYIFYYSPVVIKIQAKDNSLKHCLLILLTV